MRTIATFYLIVAILGLSTSRSEAHKKLALIVGIDKYENLAGAFQLKKAVGDATALGKTLRDLGFETKVVPDAKRTVFNREWQSLLDQIVPGDTVFFSFSGHGIEVIRQSYLLPEDALSTDASGEAQIKKESLSLNELLEDLREKKPGLAIVVIDACRTNPYARVRVTGRALPDTATLVPKPSEEENDNVFLIYSAASGQIALDRLGPNDNEPTSIFMRELLPLLTQPCLNLLDLGEDVKARVYKSAQSVNHTQKPTVYSSILFARSIFLAGCGSPPTAAENPNTGSGGSANAGATGSGLKPTPPAPDNGPPPTVTAAPRLRPQAKPKNGDRPCRNRVFTEGMTEPVCVN